MFLRNSDPGRGVRAGAASALLAALLTLGSGPTLADDGLPAGEDGPCQTNPQGALIITASCTDDAYATPVIDSMEDRDTPISGRVITGHFEGTSNRFTFVFPAQGWQGRFFQYTHPVTGEVLTDDAIAFGAEAGAYTVQATGQAGYRHLAAAAKLSRDLAADYYDVEAASIHGYLYGPSGGSYQTIGGTENTTGVWDGSVPIVMGNATSIPNNFFMRAMARLILADDAQAISNAVISGEDPYSSLDEASAAMLKEITALGVPLSGWDMPEYLLAQSFDDGGLGFGGLVQALDPTYVDDFWAEAGYLGTEDSPLGDAVRAALVDAVLEVTGIERDENGTVTSLNVRGFPAGASTEGVELNVLDGAGAQLGAIQGAIDASSGVITLMDSNEEALLQALRVGAKIDADNRWNIALRSYYRHQIPASGQGFEPYDFLRDDAGEPLYPQRALSIPGMMARNISGGAAYSGVFNGKVILVSNLQDVDAFPWHADWYAKRITTATGPGDVSDRLRIYYNENADHLEGEVVGAKTARVVPHDPMVRRALKDLAAWVEEGIEPPASSVYTVTDGQVQVPKDSSRRGIQPVVSLTAVGGEQIAERRFQVRAGDSLTFEVLAQMPVGAGNLTGIDWDITGRGEWSDLRVLTGTSGSARLTHTFAQAGTYDITARVSSTRSGGEEPFTTISNLATIRVVVLDSSTEPEPLLEVSSSVVEQGGAVMITGSGFEPDARITLTVHSDPLVVGVVTASADGVITLKWDVPMDFATGDHTVVAAGADGAELARAGLRVTAKTTGASDSQTVSAAGSESRGATALGRAGGTDKRLAVTGTNATVLLGVFAVALGSGIVLIRRRA
ncbi:hypothetical protein [Schaalia vaccimaxillae]|uniref:hypothetical protein n=1 Tax=Schaalia vaccimaxillae TaxID=183916 RepID=UPI0003B64BF4|nr:hypothetical protein [Schaalia vaccimaxillae]